MQIEVPFNYINLLAFITLLKYENKRGIKINTLQKYHQILLEEVIKDYNNKNAIYYNDVDNWKGTINFFINEQNNLNNFLNEFSHLFYIAEDTIYLHEEIGFEELMQQEIMMRTEQCISNRFLSVSDNSRLFDLLNINQIKSVIEKYIKIEQEIEKTYSKLNNNVDNVLKQKLTKLLFTRAIFLTNICQNADYIIDAFRLESYRIYELDSSYEYIKAPIDLELWKQSNYYNEDDIGDIDDRIYDIFQYAIFGKTSLVSRKTNEMLQNLYFYEDKNNNQSELLEDYFSEDLVFDDDNEYYIVDNEETDLAFYLTYLHKLDSYIKKYGESTDLINTRNRLLYALDMPKLCLFKQENFIQEWKKTKEFELEAEDFDFVEDEVKFMVDEVFMTETDENTIKKLLFISTYYELTKDKKIVKILNKHSHNSNFATYSEIIFGEPKGYSKSLFKK